MGYAGSCSNPSYSTARRRVISSAGPLAPHDTRPRKICLDSGDLVTCKLVAGFCFSGQKLLCRWSGHSSPPRDWSRTGMPAIPVFAALPWRGSPSSRDEKPCVTLPLQGRGEPVGSHSDSRQPSPPLSPSMTHRLERHRGPDCRSNSVGIRAGSRPFHPAAWWRWRREASRAGPTVLGQGVRGFRPPLSPCVSPARGRPARGSSR